MKKLRIYRLLVLLALLFPGLMVVSQDIQSEQFLDDPSVTGFEIAEGPDTYIGDDLFLLINGGADMYHEFGFVEVVAYKMSGSGDQGFSVEIYEMSDPGAAFGIWSMNYISTADNAEIDEMAFIGETYLQFWKNKYYVTISCDHSGENSRKGMNSLADIISGAINPDFSLPSVLDKMTLTDDGSQKYIRGNIALSNLYYFNYKNIFRIEEGVLEEADGQKTIRLFYKDETSASSAWENVIGVLSNSKKFLSFTEENKSLSFDDKKDRHIEGMLQESEILINITYP